MALRPGPRAALGRHRNSVAADASDRRVNRALPPRPLRPPLPKVVFPFFKRDVAGNMLDLREAVRDVDPRPQFGIEGHPLVSPQSGNYGAVFLAFRPHAERAGYRAYLTSCGVLAGIVAVDLVQVIATGIRHRFPERVKRASIPFTGGVASLVNERE